MDDLGNRTSATLRGESSKTYAVDDLTNRYDETGTFDVTLSYDNAGNVTVDENGYQYYYDYEQRIVRIEDDLDTAVATFEYDALGRRIEKVDEIASETTHYYYNEKWQVIEEYKDSTFDRWYAYGNYIDEVLFMGTGNDWYFFAHNHLFSPVALVHDYNDNVVERYEYNAYGKVTVYTNMLNWQTTTPTTASKSQVGNPYLFTGRRQDTFADTGNYEIMYYRNRYYSTETGRFITQDPFGIKPPDENKKPMELPGQSCGIATWDPKDQYNDSLNIYEYVSSNPCDLKDPSGMRICKDTAAYDQCISNAKSWHDTVKEAIDEAFTACMGACNDALQGCLDDCPDVIIIGPICQGICIGVGGVGWTACAGTCVGLHGAADSAEQIRYMAERGECGDKHFTTVPDCDECPEGYDDLGTGGHW